MCYKNGEGVTKNLVKAVEFYTLAANQGNSDAQLNLGMKIVFWYKKIYIIFLLFISLIYVCKL